MNPTREDVLKYVLDLIEGREKHPLQQGLVYKNLRETHGNNRSPDLDKMILRQGGDLGEPWCLYILQDILDCVRYKFNCIIRLPEGGGTQDFYNAIASNFKHQKAIPLSIGIYKKGDTGTGHAVLCISNFDEHQEFMTFEGNTSNETAELVRDGQGAFYRTRKLTYDKMLLRGFIDIYEAIGFKNA